MDKDEPKAQQASWSSPFEQAGKPSRSKESLEHAQKAAQSPAFKQNTASSITAIAAAAIANDDYGMVMLENKFVENPSDHLELYLKGYSKLVESHEHLYPELAKPIDPQNIFEDYDQIATQCGANFKIAERSLRFDTQEEPPKDGKYAKRRAQIQRFFDNADFDSPDSDNPAGGERLITAKDERSDTYIKINLLRVQRSTNGPGCLLVLMAEFIPDIIKTRMFKSAKIACTISRDKDLPVPKIINFEPVEGYADKDGPEVKNEGHAGVAAGPPVVKGTADISHSSTMKRLKALCLCGLTVPVPAAGCVQYNIHENESTGHGIFRHVPIYIVLDSSEPFTLGVEVVANVGGGHRPWGNRKVSSHFKIDPGKWETPKDGLDALSFYKKLNQAWIKGWAWTGST